MIRETRGSAGIERSGHWDIHEADFARDALPKWKEWNYAQCVGSISRRRGRYQTHVRHDVSLIAERLRDQSAARRRTIKNVEIELRLSHHRPGNFDANVLGHRGG